MLAFFIKRPIFASTLSIIVVLAGIMSMRILPVAQYPDISPPTVTITTVYVGASAETVASTTAAPIEAQLSGIQGLEYYTSTASSDGSLTITASFAIGTTADQATIDVSNQVQTALPSLPKAVQQIGVVVKQRSSDILMVAALKADPKAFDTLYLSNYATLNLVDDLKRIPGVGDVNIFGQRDYSMRLWLDPDKMTSLGVSVSDVINAVQSQNSLYATGRIGNEPASPGQSLVFTVASKGALTEPKEFEQIVIRASGPRGYVRVKDIAEVELGAKSYTNYMLLDDSPTVGMAIFLQSGANALDVAERVRTKMDELKRDFPSGLDYLIPFDTTAFISASISEVMITLMEAALLVIAVVYLFLQNARATLIPVIAVPVSLIGTFAGLWLFGFSINTLTLFAMVLAIGIVVDDAIVVLENVERLMRQEGLSPRKAAMKSLEEVSGAVIAIVLVLTAVFVPVAFLGGITGRLYQQFALTVATSVVLSGLVALTLTPALCSVFLKLEHREHRFFSLFNQAFERLTERYLWAVEQVYQRPKLTLIGYFGLCAVLGAMYQSLAKSFVPSEDQGYLIGSLMLPDNASLSRTGNFAQHLQKSIRSLPEIAHVIGVVGFDLIAGANKANSGTLFITLNPWDQRARTTDDLLPPLSGQGASSSEGFGLILNPPPIRGLGNAGGFEMYIQARTNVDFKAMGQVVDTFVDALRKEPRLSGINSFFKPNIPRLRLEIDEDKAMSLGVAINDIYQTIQSTVGAYYINDFYLYGKTFQVQIQADPSFRAKPNDFSRLYVRAANQKMVSLGSLVKVHYAQGPEQVDRFNGFVAAHLMGGGAPGVSSNTAIALVEDIANRTLPKEYKLAWTGEAFQEKQSSSSTSTALGFALIMVFLILCAQYESWTLPIAVLMSVPLALTGAFTALAIRHGNNDVYFQIGLVVLIGLSAKNAILIIEFASQKVAQGMRIKDAALMAARLRFRPIIMTSLAFILGITPLAFASGAGSAARRSMGIGVLGGMLAATLIAPMFIPLFFKWWTREPASQIESSDES